MRRTSSGCFGWVSSATRRSARWTSLTLRRWRRHERSAGSLAQRRRVWRAPGAAVSPAAVPVTPAGTLAWAGLLPAFGSPELLQPRDVATDRDLEILRGFKQGLGPAVILDGLSVSGLDDDEPWTEQRVIERHDFLRRSVRTTARLVGPEVVASSMHELVALCM